MLLRGYIVLIPCFILLPTVHGIKGLWLAEPLSETMTLMALILHLSLHFVTDNTDNRHNADNQICVL